MRSELFEDRVYVLTPKGEVIDLPRGATPLDFAYSVHTSLGHRCRGAKANGRIVPLTHALANGEIVEIITGKQEAPSRDWLAPEQGYLASPRNRSKVRAWFRTPGRRATTAAPARAIAERELARIGALHGAARGARRASSRRATSSICTSCSARARSRVTQLMHAASRLFDAGPTGAAGPPRRRQRRRRRLAGGDRRGGRPADRRWRAAARRCARSRSPATSPSAAA